MGKVLFISCTNVGKAMIEEIYNNKNIVNSEVVGIVNLNQKKGADKANYFTYDDIAIKYGIDIHFCNNVNDEVTLNWIREKNPDIIIQSGWSQKFGNELLSIPKYGCIGEHPAPLPRGRGAACINWAIITGEKEWGDTFFQMIDEYDKGFVYAQSFFNIESYDNVFTVYEKVALSSQKIIAQYIDEWSNGHFVPLAQDDSKATYYKRRRPKDGEFTFDRNAEELHNFIRGQAHPYPGAYFMLDDKKVIVQKTELSNRLFSDRNPGDFIIEGKNSPIVYAICKDGQTISLLRVQPEGKPSMWAKDWLESK